MCEEMFIQNLCSTPSWVCCWVLQELWNKESRWGNVLLWINFPFNIKISSLNVSLIIFFLDFCEYNFSNKQKKKKKKQKHIKTYHKLIIKSLNVYIVRSKTNIKKEMRKKIMYKKLVMQLSLYLFLYVLSILSFSYYVQWNENTQKKLNYPIFVSCTM